MYFAFVILMLGSCAKRSLIQSAKFAFHNNTQCVETLREYMRAADCDSFLHREDGKSITLRCYKDAGKRGKFWDNYWFRISPSSLVLHEDVIDEIEAHTICLDDDNRLEAYPPN